MAAALAATVTKRLKVLVAGGHPGDPECGCGGTIARYSALGHQVVVLYLNRGEGFCGKAELSQCGSIRTGEAQKACGILKARPLFATQIDGQAVVDAAHYKEFDELILAERPDVIFTQWPIDEHRDHRAISQLILDAWLRSGRLASFYYYEVVDDTMMFSPAEFVDISSDAFQSARHDACYAHSSQAPQTWYPKQVELTKLRGSESGYSQAEGFVRHWQSKTSQLP